MPSHATHCQKLRVDGLEQLIAERSEANNRVQWGPNLSYRLDVRHVLGPRGPPGNQDGIRADTCVPSSNSWHTKSQRSTQVDYIVLLRKAYCSSQVSRVCVAAL